MSIDGLYKVSDAFFLFGAGMVVGAVVVLAAIRVRALRRDKAAGPSRGLAGAQAIVPNVLNRTTSTMATPGPAPVEPEAEPSAPRSAGGGIVGNLVGRSVANLFEGKPGRRVIRTVHQTRIQLGGAEPGIVVDGTPYRRLEDVPEPQRDLVVEELRAAAAQLPEDAARAKIDAFIAAAAEEETSPVTPPVVPGS